MASSISTAFKTLLRQLSLLPKNPLIDLAFAETPRASDFKARDRTIGGKPISGLLRDFQVHGNLSNGHNIAIHDVSRRDVGNFQQNTGRIGNRQGMIALMLKSKAMSL